MTISHLSDAERVTRTAAYMRRSVSVLKALLITMGLSTEGTKTELVNRILDHAGKAEGIVGSPPWLSRL